MTGKRVERATGETAADAGDLVELGVRNLRWRSNASSIGASAALALSFSLSAARARTGRRSWRWTRSGSGCRSQRGRHRAARRACQAPAGRRVALAETGHDDRGGGGLGRDGGGTDVFRAIVGEMLVHLVRHQVEPVFEDDADERLHLGLRVDGAGGVRGLLRMTRAWCAA